MQSAVSPSDPDAYLRSRDVMKLCGVSSHKTLKAWQRNYGFPLPAILGNFKAYRRGDVLDWLESRKATVEA